VQFDGVVATVADRIAQEVARRYLEQIVDSMPTLMATGPANRRSTPCIKLVSAVGCESAWDPDADRHAKLLIHLAVEGSTFNAYLQPRVRLVTQ
jgi:hypothetical protein